MDNISDRYKAGARFRDKGRVRICFSARGRVLIKFRYRSMGIKVRVRQGSAGIKAGNQRSDLMLTWFQGKEGSWARLGLWVFKWWWAAENWCKKKQLTLKSVL